MYYLAIMGYHAPSSEEVYRYLFRLDKSQPRLCDGFGWSILFVNDNSALCKTFLSDYGAELCYRTADRVRFVFFSGLSTAETEHVVNRGIGSRGMLASIIAAAASWKPWNKFDLERDKWARFRPEAFRPLDSPERVRRQLSFECEVNSAMPGSEEALQLAQRLGIGRFVPCFLLFADVGSTEVYLYPVARQSPASVFDRLRSWVDEFYEINRSTLSRWAAIEHSIDDLTSKLQVSISKVEAWKREKEDKWRQLQKMSHYLRQLRTSEPNTNLLKQIADDGSLPWEVTSQIRSFGEQVRSFDRTRAQAAEIGAWIARLNAASDSLHVYEELSRFSKQDALPQALQERIDTAIELFRPTEQSESPESELRRWWRSEYGRPPSRNQYERYRSAWSELSRRKYGCAATGNVASIIKAEFAVASQTILAQPVTAEPEQTTQLVLDRIAQHLDVSPTDTAWVDCTSHYRQAVLKYFKNLISQAPTWVVQVGGLSQPPLTWGDCIPPVPIEKEQRRSLTERIEQLPVLNQLVQQLKNGRESRLSELENSQKLQQSRCLGELTHDIDSWLSSTKLVDSDKRSLWFAVTEMWAHARQLAEREVFDNAKLARQAPYPGDSVSHHNTSHLLLALDEYVDAVNSLRFPFARDPDVLRISLRMSLADVSELREDLPVSARALSVKGDLAHAVQDSEKSVKAWESIRQQAATWTPASKFVSALIDVLPLSRLRDLLPSIKSADDAPAELSNQPAFIDVLDGLAAQELIDLERRVWGEGLAGRRPRANTKSDLYDSILGAIGLLRDEGTTGTSAKEVKKLEEKVREGVFDVFLAHNTQDRAEVMRLGEELRHRGIYPWIDVEQIPPGQWFQDVIQSAVRSIKAAAIVIGKSGVGRWQSVELRAFVSRCIENGTPLIPVLLPGTASIPHDLPFLRELNYVKFTADVCEDGELARLVWGITGERPLGIGSSSR